MTLDPGWKNSDPGCLSRIRNTSINWFLFNNNDLARSALPHGWAAQGWKVSSWLPEAVVSASCHTCTRWGFSCFRATYHRRDNANACQEAEFWRFLKTLKKILFNIGTLRHIFFVIWFQILPPLNCIFCYLNYGTYINFPNKCQCGVQDAFQIT